MPMIPIIPAGSGKPLAPYSPGAKADGVVYVSGTLPFDRDNNVVHAGDPAAQTRHVLTTIRSVVEAAGGTMADVTFNQIFITDWANYAAINAVYAEFFPGDKPAASAFNAAWSSRTRSWRSPLSPTSGEGGGAPIHHAR